MKSLSFKHVLIGLTVLMATSHLYCQNNKELPPPNILWIVSEDNSPLFGCYGDSFATTPNLDKLASEGFLYTHAYANAPVCAPARNTILTGVYANSNGSENMRSYYKKSAKVNMYPVLMRKAGYYCSNNAKADYNFNKKDTQGIWDERSKKAHYKNRKPGQPFLAVFNLGITHESSIHKSIPDEKLHHNPDKVTLPPYHPDTKEMRHDWAQYYDKIEVLDTQVAKILKELENAGLADSTIVFYYGDHGGVLGRSKRFVYESGTQVPFIIRIPDMYKHLFPAEKPGMKVDRLISFVDLAPTLLSLAGAKIPEEMQGDAFLGSQKTPDPENVFMFRSRMDECFDMSRAVRDEKYRYIHNYMPYRIYGQHLDFLWRAPSMRSWEKAWKEGKCNDAQSAFWKTKPAEELYDTENDPWEVNNLADDPAYKERLVKMRKICNVWEKNILDAGFIPEIMLTELAGKTPFYDYMRSSEVDMDALISAANLATLGCKTDIPEFVKMLKSDYAPIRYWGATGLLIIGKEAKSVRGEILKGLNDPMPDVVIVLAEAAYRLGEKDKAKEALLNLLNSPKKPKKLVRKRAQNVIDALNIATANN
jgi:arylsulfatase A-like enzyme